MIKVGQEVYVQTKARGVVKAVVEEVVREKGKTHLGLEGFIEWVPASLVWENHPVDIDEGQYDA